MSNDREPTSEERWRAAFAPEARAERRVQAEESRRQRTTAIERAFGKVGKRDKEDGG